MAETKDDIYRGHSPRAFVVIGGKAILVEDYKMTITDRGEAGTASIKIPMDTVDTDVFGDDSVMDNIMEVEIWAGYLTDNMDPEEQLKTIYSDIQNKKDQPYFTKRFSGYVLQPEWQIGKNGKYITLSCIDWTGFLRDFKFVRSLHGSYCEIRQIVALMQNDIEGLKIELAPYNGNIYLGTIDNKSHHIAFDAVGKTYWQILEEIVVKLSYVMLVDDKTIRLLPKKKNPLLWKLFSGLSVNLKDKNNVAVGQYFEEVHLRYGQKGRIDKSNVVIECFGTNWSKKGKKSKPVHVVYGVTETKHGRRGKPRVLDPHDVSITTNTKYVQITVPGNVRERQLEVIAETAYREYATRLITGSVNLPYANNFMNLQDIVTFIHDDSVPELAHFEDIHFSINSISEDYSKSGYSQTIEFDSDPTLDNAPQGKIVPQDTKVPAKKGQTK